MAGPKPNHFPKPGPVDNTIGVVLPKTEPNTAGTSSNPPVKPVTEAGKGFLERNKAIVQKAIDDFVEARPDSTLAQVAGSAATAVNQVFFPEAAWELIPAGKVAKLLKKGAEAVGVVKKVDKAEDAAQVARKAPEPQAAQGSGGGYVKGPRKHRRSRDPCKHPRDAKKRKYVVYRADEFDDAGNKIGTYIGRTSGDPNDTTRSILKRRRSGHHRKGLGALEALFETDSYAGARGAEQLLKDKYSSVKQIEPIGDRNARKGDYLDCAKSKGAP